MLDSQVRSLEALRILIRSSHLARADDVPVIVDRAAAALGSESSQLFVVDYDQILLVPLTPPGTAVTVAMVSVDGSMAGRAFRDLQLVSSSQGSGSTVWTPVVNGTERLGVLEMHFPVPALSDETLESCRDLGGLVADLVLSRNMYGDLIQRARRREQMSIPAEMQWHQLPPMTFVSPHVAIAGVLAPTAEVAGDSFDYAVNGDIAHVAIIDAMGHGLEATLLSFVAIGSLRNARRGGLGLEATVRLMDAQLVEQFGGDKFVTGIVGELDCSTGVWRWYTCGHPPALMVRDGRVVKSLDAVTDVPMGLHMLPRELRIGEEHLQPGDSLILYTDGVVEARDTDDQEFGVPRLVDLISRESIEGRSAAETMRRLNLAIMDHQDGELQDDATTVMVQWLKPDLGPDIPQ